MPGLLNCKFTNTGDIYQSNFSNISRAMNNKQLLSHSHNGHPANHILSSALVPLHDKTFRAETRVPSPLNSAIRLKIFLY